jgi:hypothetical protein
MPTAAASVLRGVIHREQPLRFRTRTVRHPFSTLLERSLWQRVHQGTAQVAHGIYNAAPVFASPASVARFLLLAGPAALWSCRRVGLWAIPQKVPIWPLAAFQWFDVTKRLCRKVLQWCAVAPGCCSELPTLRFRCASLVLRGALPDGRFQCCCASLHN